MGAKSVLSFLVAPSILVISLIVLVASSANPAYTALPCPCSIWSLADTPAIASEADTSAVELGVRFNSTVVGFITGIRFYKGSLNTGTHVATLWQSDGTPLATATFSGESASGWQSVSFATPVAIAASTTYVASYHAPNGGFSVTRPYFDVSGFSNPPLYALKDGEDGGGNGVFVFGTGGFPGLLRRDHAGEILASMSSLSC